MKEIKQDKIQERCASIGDKLFILGTIALITREFKDMSIFIGLSIFSLGLLLMIYSTYGAKESI